MREELLRGLRVGGSVWAGLFVVEFFLCPHIQHQFLVAAMFEGMKAFVAMYLAITWTAYRQYR